MATKNDKANNRFYPIEDFVSIASHLTIIPAKSILSLDHYELRESICIIDKKEQEFCFPQYFSSDGGSIPWAVRVMFPPGGRALPAYIIHDYYCDKATRSGLYRYREIGDKQFYQHLRDCGYARWRAWPMSKAVIGYGKYMKLTGKLK